MHGTEFVISVVTTLATVPWVLGSTRLSTGIVVRTAVWSVDLFRSNRYLACSRAPKIDLNQLMPAEIGHAAAYEAYRTWMHNSSIYEPLSGELERQREGLTGLAVAEGGVPSLRSIHGP